MRGVVLHSTKAAWSERSYLIQGLGKGGQGTFGEMESTLVSPLPLGSIQCSVNPLGPSMCQTRVNPGLPAALLTFPEPLLGALIACHSTLLRAPASHVTRWSAGLLRAGSTVCGGRMPTGRPRINQQQRTGAVFAGAGCGSPRCVRVSASLRGPVGLGGVHSSDLSGPQDWGSGRGHRRCRGAGVVMEAPGGWPTFQEGLGQDACGWLEEGLEAQGSAPLPSACAPAFPRQTLGLACPLRPRMPRPHTPQTCWVAPCAPSHPRREEGNLARDPHKNRCISG